MATSTIEAKVTRIIDNELKSINTNIVPSGVSPNDVVALSISRYGRATGITTLYSSLVTASNGIVLPFGPGINLTIIGNGSDGFKILSSDSGLTNVYVNLFKL